MNEERKNYSWINSLTHTHTRKIHNKGLHLTPSCAGHVSALKKEAAGIQCLIINPSSKVFPQIRKKQNTRLLHFLSGPSLWQCRCLSGVLCSDVILEVPELGLESLPPTETLLWPSPSPWTCRPCPQQVGWLQHRLRMFPGLHPQGCDTGCPVTLAPIWWQEGEAHWVRHTAGTQWTS